MNAVLAVVLFTVVGAKAASIHALVSWGFGSEPKIIETDVLDVVASRYAFAAIKKGGVENWGSSKFSGESQIDLRNVKKVVASEKAFAAITENGYVTSWGSQVYGGDSSATDLDSNVVEEVVASTNEFAAIKQGGSVSWWGHPQALGSPKPFFDVKDKLMNVTSIKATRGAFAAISAGGVVVTWGSLLEGAQSDEKDRQLGNITEIFHTRSAFAALTASRGVVVWGERAAGGSLGGAQAELSSNVETVFSNAKAFVALKDSGQIVAWGDAISGGDISTVKGELRNKQVVKVFSTMYAFAALTTQGEVVTWGNVGRGGDSSSVKSKLQSGVESITSNNYAFAARKGGEIITWGNDARGGDSSVVGSQLLEDVEEVYGNDAAFVAVKKNGEVIAWGSSSSGGLIPDGIRSKLKSRVSKIVAYTDGKALGHPNGKAFAALICLPSIAENQCKPLIRCPDGHVWNTDDIQCDACKDNEVANPSQTFCHVCSENGTVPSNNRSHCVSCENNEFALAGVMTVCKRCMANEVPDPSKAACMVCGYGKVPSSLGDECEKCPSGYKRSRNGEVCESCGPTEYSHQGSDECYQCEPSWFLSKNANGEGCQLNLETFSPIASGVFVLLIGCVLAYKEYQHRERLLRQIIEVNGTDIQAMQKTLHRASRARCLLRRGRRLVLRLEKQLKIQEDRYTTLDALQLILDEGHLKMLHSSSFCGQMDGVKDRMVRQQDLLQRIGKHAFWTGRRLRQRARMVVLVAISYCWIHPVHPDPKGLYLAILSHAVKLRLSMRGKAAIQDMAIFLDYMSLAQHGETGNTNDPSEGIPRTQEENESFKKGLLQVNVPYACQLVETWILAWTPAFVESKYEDRAWPTFERIISSLVKDSHNIVSLSDLTLRETEPVAAFGQTVLKRVAPQTPERFNEIIMNKHVTHGKDVDILKEKYQQTFSDVIGNGKSLWFANLGWGDEEVLELCEVFPHCSVLVTVILSGNEFNAEAAKKLVAAAGRCKSLQRLDLGDNPIEPNDHEIIRDIWIEHDKKPASLNLSSRKEKYELDEENFGDDGESCDEQSRLMEQSRSMANTMTMTQAISLFQADEDVCSPEAETIGAMV